MWSLWFTQTQTHKHGSYGGEGIRVDCLCHAITVSTAPRKVHRQRGVLSSVRKKEPSESEQAGVSLRRTFSEGSQELSVRLVKKREITNVLWRKVSMMAKPPAEADTRDNEHIVCSQRKFLQKDQQRDWPV